MAYATAEDVRRVLARDLQHVEGTAAELLDPQIELMIVAAQATIDQRLARRYAVPFADPVSASVNALAVAVAAYHSDLIHRQSVDQERADPVALRYRWAMQMIDRIANGEDDLPGVSARASGAYAINQYAPAMFSLEDVGLAYVDTSAPYPWPATTWGYGTP